VDVSLQRGAVLRPNCVFGMSSRVASKLGQGSYFPSDIILGLGKFSCELVHLFLRSVNTGPARDTIELLSVKEWIEGWAVTYPKNILPLELGQEGRQCTSRQFIVVCSEQSL
jgi:hypothetical protein